MRITPEVMRAFNKEMSKHAIAAMPMVMGGLYGVDTLSQVGSALKKTNPANAVGANMDMRNYPEH